MMFDDTYRTITTPSESSFRDRGSRFLGYAYPVKSENEVKETLSILKKKYHDANHHCFAFRLGADHSAYRFSDDGEPNNSAGRPIYNQINSHDLTNILIVVVRYFGGTLLGVSGLINAYRTTASLAIEASEIIEKTANENYLLTFSYEVMHEIMPILKEPHILNAQYDMGENCKVNFAIRKSLAMSLTERIQKVSSVKLEFTGIS
ncbi:MAG: YigZ family protein [Bacteroidota bacterium]